MNAYEPSQVEGTDLELTDRDARALTEKMSVLPEGGDIYTVVGENGRTYIVDAREGRCTCPDAQYNLPTDDGRETCKHAARVTYAAGISPTPAWVERDAVDELLGEHTDVTPRIVAADGGQVFDENESENGGEDRDERPDACECWDTDTGLPCFACWLAGFDAPNSDVDGE